MLDQVWPIGSIICVYGFIRSTRKLGNTNNIKFSLLRKNVVVKQWSITDFLTQLLGKLSMVQYMVYKAATDLYKNKNCLFQT